MAKRLTVKELKARIKDSKATMRKYKQLLNFEIKSGFETDGTAFMMDDLSARKALSNFVRAAKQLTNDLGKLHNLET